MAFNWRLASAVLLALATLSVAGISAWLGSVRADYRPMVMSMSVLGERGSDRAGLFNAALGLLGGALFLAGVAVGRRRPGAWIALAGVVIVALALVPIDPGASGVTLVHRSLTACALVSLVVAVFTGAGGAVRWLALVGLLLGAGLLVDGFPGGLWERAMFVLLLGWVEIYLVACARNSAASAAS